MPSRFSTDYRNLRPYVLEDVRAIVSAGSGGSNTAAALTAHRLNDTTIHLGQLDPSQATWALTATTGVPSTRQVVAGAGLTGGGDLSADRTFTVGAGAGITVNADDVALTTPGTLTVSSTNSATGSHTHAITASSDVGTSPVAALLKSTSGGGLTLGSVTTNQAVSLATFASGFAGSGFRADYGVTTASRASVETDDLTVRGRMRVYELLIQQIRATNGSLFVSSASKVVSTTTSTNPTWTVNGSQLTFNGSNATLTTTLYTISTAAAGDTSKELYHGFLYGDVIRAQQTRWNGSAFAGTVQSDLEVTAVTNLYTYQAALVSGDAAAVGYDYVRLGSSSDTARQGSVYITSDDSAAPYIDIVDGVRYHADWNSAAVARVRVGKLTGITDAVFGGALSGYGLYGNNVYLKGSIYATSGQFSGTVYADAGSFTGTLTSTAGTIGGWTLGATSLTAGSGATTVGLDSGGTNPALYAGSATPGSAPFRVTAAGALTATSATITGAITASSGSLTGYLTLGSDGGIYQGTGTAASPTTGLKIWNDTGVGRIGAYNAGDLQWFNSTTGYLYAGRNATASTTQGADRWGVRLARDGVRLLAEATTSFNQSTSASSIRWIFNSSDDIDAALSTATSYASLYAYNNTSVNVVYSGMTTFVGSGVYTTKDATVYLSAQHYTGSVYHGVDFTLTCVKNTGATYAYCNADEFQIPKVLKMDEMTAPAAPGANTVYIFAQDNGSGKTQLCARFSSGAIQQIAIQP